MCMAEGALGGLLLHLLQHLLHGLLEQVRRHLAGLHREGYRPLRDFFLHSQSPPFSAAVHIVTHQGSVVAVNSGRSVIQGSQQIFLDVTDIGGVLPHTVQHILDMGTVQPVSYTHLATAGSDYTAICGSEVSSPQRATLSDQQFLYRPCAVSYTHLDVYKRQEHN